MNLPGSSPAAREDPAVRVAIAVAFAVVAAIVFFPFLTTRFVTSDDAELGLLGWREVAAAAFPYARTSGRFYFLVSTWFGWLPYAFDSRAWFKGVQMLGLSSNFAALSYLSWKLTRSRSFALFATLVGLVTMQARWDHNLVSAFPWSFSCALTLGMVSIGAFVGFLETGDRRRQLLSGGLFFLSLLVYESFLLYGIAFVLLAWPWRAGVRRGVASVLRATWPHAALGALYLVAYLGFRLAFPTHHPGNQVRFSARAMVAVWTTFTRSALPAAAFGDQTRLLNDFSDDYGGFDGSPLAVFTHPRVEWLVLALVAAVLGALLLRNAAARGQQQRLGRTAAVGAVLAITPQLLHGLAPQYQQWVQWGVKAYVPGYLAAFGVTLVIASALVAVSRALRNPWPWTSLVAAALAGVALLTAFSNFYVARSQTIARRKWDLVDALLDTRKLPDGAVVLAPSWWDGVEIMNVLDDYWTRYARRKARLHLQIVRTIAQFEAACGAGCSGRAFFSKYARAGQEDDQFILVAPLEGDPAQGLWSHSADGFVLARNHLFSVFAALRGDAPSVVTVDGEPITAAAKGSVWLRVERLGNHQRPLPLRLSSAPALLDPDSIVFSGYVAGDRFADSVRPVFGDGFFSQEQDHGESWNWAQERATLVLHNETGFPHQVTVSFVVQGSAPSCHVEVEAPGQSTAASREPPAEYRFTVRLAAWKDGEIRFRSDCPRAAGDPRDLRFNLRKLQVTEDATPVKSP